MLRAVVFKHAMWVDPVSRLLRAWRAQARQANDLPRRSCAQRSRSDVASRRTRVRPCERGDRRVATLVVQRQLAHRSRGSGSGCLDPLLRPDRLRCGQAFAAQFPAVLVAAPRCIAGEFPRGPARALARVESHPGGRMLLGPAALGAALDFVGASTAVLRTPLPRGWASICPSPRSMAWVDGGYASTSVRVRVFAAWRHLEGEGRIPGSRRAACRAAAATVSNILSQARCARMRTRQARYQLSTQTQGMCTQDQCRVVAVGASVVPSEARGSRSRALEGRDDSGGNEHTYMSFTVKRHTYPHSLAGKLPVIALLVGRRLERAASNLTSENMRSRRSAPSKRQMQRKYQICLAASCVKYVGSRYATFKAPTDGHPTTYPEGDIFDSS